QKPRKSSGAALAAGSQPRQHDGNKCNQTNRTNWEDTAMARAKAKAGSRTKKVAGRSATPRKPAARRSTAKPRWPHKFVKSHHREEDFKSDGLRTYAHYRDLGVKDATHGLAVAHVIRFQGKCDPKIVSKDHLHEADFQMIYVLKGTITTEI